MSRDVEPEPRWLLLVHQLPAKPPYLRVKVWRRLQALGAVSLKNSVYALPAGEETREDLEWVLREIERGGGDGVICEARLVDGLTDEEVRGRFDAARDADYGEIADELREIGARLKRGRRAPSADAMQRTATLRRRLAEIAEIDFFGATGRLTVEALLAELEARFAEPSPEKPASAGAERQALTGRTWVTRSGVHIDRIACAWLIRRFIDPEARFKFVAAKDYAPRPGELRFDMFEAEFTHEGESCSFEVLLDRIGLDDPALRAIGEIVHDIDLKDAKFGREQTAGIAHVIAGVCATQDDDLARIERGGAVLDDTYELFRRRQRSPRSARTRAARSE
jgi:hypothetical protein